ncbi:MAG TPA: hydrogenase small subunit, partial [Candidatus Omnitrophota bacterium]|nr:hydrogenase small subunit [Candidatus Omnitrophota bacterium]
MELTRREFLQLCSASAMGMGLSQMAVPKLVSALEEAAAKRPPVIWLQGASCSGCSVSLLNTAHPKIADVLTKIISLEYHPTVMAAAGELAFSYLDTIAEKAKGDFFLVVEGSIPTKDHGVYCTIGEKDGKEVTMLEMVQQIGPKAKAIVAVGTCSTFGGIPAGKPDPTGAQPISKIVTGVPIINIPGCPPHPDWMLGTIVHVLLFGIPELDKLGRPKLFFGE